jgi:riboflavin synthase
LEAFGLGHDVLRGKALFTGIVEEIGTVERIESGRESLRIGISAHQITLELSMGDSVSVNGVCLTATEVTPKGFRVTAVSKTLKLSMLTALKKGDRLNLEMAMRFNDRLGGHFVQGHSDGIGKVDSIRNQGDAKLLTFRIPGELSRYIVLRGSVAINGVSLTVAELHGDRITVSVVPYTLEHTNLKFLKKGSPVNVETDMLGKYIEKLLDRRPETKKNSNWMLYAE